MQFRGSITRRGVGLRFYLTKPNMKTGISGNRIYADSPCLGEPVTEIKCEKCGCSHPHLYVAYRKPVGMIGCWVQFRINGVVLATDLSVPIATFRLPRDAKPMTGKENDEAWHRE